MTLALPKQVFERLPGISPSVYSQADFDAIREILYADSGIVLPPGKAMLVYSRLTPLVRLSATDTFGGYVDLIRQDMGERRKAICALTTNHTFFFREVHHFDHLASEVRMPLLTRAAKSPVRIWSAGCSSGEETWSIAMTLLGEDRSMARALGERDFAILATDLADHALATARAATYPVSSIDAIPGALRSLWMKERNDQAILSQDVVKLVRFRMLNLLGPWPMERQFDVIFCRNVMIYFDQPTKERLMARLCDQLLPGGHLYIGHSERVTGPAEKQLTLVGNTIYRKDNP